jgi:hypothetical protein
MTVTEIQKAKRRLDPERTLAAAERTYWTDRLATALREPDPDRYDPTLTAYCHQHIAAADVRLRDLDERDAALDALLPTADAISSARSEARTFVIQLTALHERMSNAQSAHLNAFDVIEGTARELFDATRTARLCRTQLMTLVEQYGLEDIVVQPAPTMSGADVERASLVSELAYAVVVSEPADLVTHLAGLVTCDEAQERVETTQATSL